MAAQGTDAWLIMQACAAVVVCIATFILLRALRSRIVSEGRSRMPEQPKAQAQMDANVVANNKADGNKITLLYATTTGHARALALRLKHKVAKACSASVVRVCDLSTYEYDNLEQEKIVIFICSTWVDGEAPESARPFFAWLEDLSYDFRVGKSYLSRTHFAVFGLGNSDYDNDFCRAPKRLFSTMTAMGAIPMSKICLGDDSQDTDKAFNKWNKELISTIVAVTRGESPPTLLSGVIEGSFDPQAPAIGKQVKGARDDEPIVLEDEDRINETYLNEDCEEERKDHPKEQESLVDLEEIGNVMHKQLQAKETNAESSMVTPLQRKALTKEGYKIIGTHSAVKLCRWTKHQLRGRGGCYKHTFYGITSYQCMEATPSLACANKCVFCWRHHKNPVGREWRWKTDEPDMIVREAIALHRGMIREARGVPGVKPERLEEAMTVRHCALSLVGEPIMYPRINDLVRELHTKGISTFLVTNAQFPECISELHPVTQLYVSIDAATKDSLRAVDRPLFRDFWERFINSLRALSLKRQRTVFRLTLVKGWNMEELAAYMSLIDLGTPDFIEIKAVTYCGTSDASTLTMQNVPWHEEVCAFAEEISRQSGNKYALATEHQHSCCVLLAKTKFLVDGVWHTWINYDRFNELIQDYYLNGTEFDCEDYMAPTPHWALYHAEERGFDPEEQRFRKLRHGMVHEEYKPSDSGCG